MSVLDDPRVERFFTSLPEATDSWHCKWFRGIVYFSCLAIACGATVIPGTLGILSIALGCLQLGFVVGMRE